jgi:predicted AlkP superfamily phosphohydrolase/phosphomutase
MTGTSGRRRVLVLALDGADWKVIRPLVERGELPTIRRLMDSGASGDLASSLPPLSAPAWISFLLGQTPGEHGVVDFLERDARLYEGTTGHAVTSNDFAKATLFDVAGAAGRRVAAVRVPMMFPPWPVNGVMVSGGFIPGSRVYCSPPELASALDVGTVNIGKRLMEQPEDEQFETIALQLERKEEQARRVLALEPFDLAMVHVHTPDNAHHCFWHHMERPAGSAEPNRVFDLYRRIDAYMDRVLHDRAWDLVVVMSDHGGGPRPVRRLLANPWLGSLGLLTARGGYRSRMAASAAFVKRRFRRVVHRVRAMAPERLQRTVSALTQGAVAIDWTRTEAYAVHLFHPFFGIELNVAGRQRDGIVPAGDARQRVEEIAALLRMDAKRRGLPVVSVLTREEAFGGGADPRLPDIVLELEADAEGDTAFGGSAQKNAHFVRLVEQAGPPRPNEPTGSHTPAGIVILSGEGVRPGNLLGARIEDLAPTILRYMGVQPPASMTGRVITEAFDAEALRVAGNPPPTGALGPPVGATSRMAEISAQEEAEIMDSLRTLGYVE